MGLAALCCEAARAPRASWPHKDHRGCCIAQSCESFPASSLPSRQKDRTSGRGGIASARQLVSAAPRLQPGKCDVDQPCSHPAPGRASLPCSGTARGHGREQQRSRCSPAPPRHGGGRRTRDLPHLPVQQHGRELMRSKVRGRRRADNLLAPQAAGGARAAEGRHLPPLPPAPSISSLIMRLLLARCLTAGTSISCLFVLPIPTCGYGSGESGRKGSPCPRAWVWPRAWVGGRYSFDLACGGDGAPVLTACPPPLLSLEGFWPVAACFDRGRSLKDN